MPRFYHEPRSFDDDDPFIEETVNDDEITETAFIPPRIITADNYNDFISEQEMEQKEIAAKKSAEVRIRNLWRAYDLSGVAPPTLSEDGSPAVSLPLLLKLGWKIEEVDGRRVLIGPARD